MTYAPETLDEFRYQEVLHSVPLSGADYVTLLHFRSASGRCGGRQSGRVGCESGCRGVAVVVRGNASAKCRGRSENPNRDHARDGIRDHHRGVHRDDRCGDHRDGIRRRAEPGLRQQK